MTATQVGTVVGTGAATDLEALRAFLRRDLLTAWSYKTVFFSDLISLAAQVVLFSFVAKLVNPAQLPSYGGEQTGYLPFVVVGIAVTAFLQVGLGRMATVISSERYLGTLESLFMTPVRTTVLQLGSVAYDLVYVPLRTLVFLAAVGVGFGLGLDAGGALPAAVLLLGLLPVVWGLGLISAAGVLLFRRGAGVFGLAAFGLTVLSGAYFPLRLLPDGLQQVAAVNPLAITVEGMRTCLLGGSGWADVLPDLGLLLLWSAGCLAAGLSAFRWALHRELRAGTLGMY